MVHIVIRMMECGSKRKLHAVYDQCCSDSVGHIICAAKNVSR